MTTRASLATMLADKPGAWVERAACRDATDPDIWHAPEKVRGKGKRLTPQTIEALAICTSCPVSTECLVFALSRRAEHDWGVWGATTERQRRAHRSERERHAVTSRRGA